MESLTLDIRFAFRTFAKRRGLTALLLVLMVSGTALNTAVFSIVNAALLRPMSGNFERLVVGRGLALAATGAAAGTVLAAFTTRFLASILYGLSPNEPATFAATCIGILLVSALAAYLPARRAASIPPTTALRHE